jgi:hypothetical protein
MPAIWAGVATAAVGAFGASKSASAAAKAFVPHSNAQSTIGIDNSGWVVNFRGVASSSGRRDIDGGGGDLGAAAALASDVQTPLGAVPAWALVAGVALVAVAIKKRKK